MLPNDLPPQFVRVYQLYDSWHLNEQRSFSENLWRFFLCEQGGKPVLRFPFSAKKWVEMLHYVSELAYGHPSPRTIWAQVYDKMCEGFDESVVNSFSDRIMARLRKA